MDIHTALQIQSEPHIQAFLKSNIEIDVRDSQDQTPLHIACAQGLLPVVQKLINKKANINATESKQWTPLHCAANEQHLQVCEYLIKNKANLNSKTQDGNCVLHYLVKTRSTTDMHTKLINYVLANTSLSIDEINSRNESPLVRASLSSDPQMITHLLALSANINQS